MSEAIPLPNKYNKSFANQFRYEIGIRSQSIVHKKILIRTLEGMLEHYNDDELVTRKEQGFDIVEKLLDAQDVIDRHEETIAELRDMITQLGE